MSNEQQRNERDELAKVIRDQIAWSLEAEQGIRTITDAILAAGYRKARTITSAEELDALPEGSIVMGDWATYQLVLGSWVTYGGPGAEQPPLPATVLYEGAL